MTINQILKWRKQILSGKSKYYPKELIGDVVKMEKIFTQSDKGSYWQCHTK
jgi:hypothetical protein